VVGQRPLGASLEDKTWYWYERYWYERQGCRSYGFSFAWDPDPHIKNERFINQIRNVILAQCVPNNGGSTPT